MNEFATSSQDEIIHRISTYTGDNPNSIKVEKIRALLVKLKDDLRPKTSSLMLLGQKQGLVEEFKSEELISDLEKVALTLDSLVFRIAVIGEFSKGKSTLLNAIIGEEIQPSRMIPCSANINVLKYGERQKVTVKNKDGSLEEIPLEEYKDKAVMPIEAAISNHTDTLVNSNIEEIIYEHPGLELFKNGIELIDSPGLNQHPDLEKITQKIIKGVDAIVFVTSCLQPLTQNERQLLQSLKSQLNQLSGKGEDQPAQNIFIVVNFIDLIRTNQDRQQISLLFQELAKGKNPTVIDESRIHFISAQKALDAIVNNDQDDEYLQGFRSFIEQINGFLNQRGYLIIQQPCNKFGQIVKEYLKELDKSEAGIEKELRKMEDEINRVADQIGHAENCQKEILLEAERLLNLSNSEISENWQQWSSQDSLKTMVDRESIGWSSNFNPVFQQREIIQDYVEQFNKDLQSMLEKWGQEQISEVLQPKSQDFEDFINRQLEAIRLRVYGEGPRNREIFNYQKYQMVAKLEDNFFGIIGIRGGVIIGSVIALIAGVLSQPHLVNAVAAGAISTILGSLGLGTLDVDQLKPQIKDKVITQCLERFERSKFEKDMQKAIQSAFTDRAKNINKEIDKLILQWKADLQKKEKTYETTKGGHKSDQIKGQRSELEQVLHEIDVLLSEVSSH
jgi:GTPase SAR1 family protein